MRKRQKEKATTSSRVRCAKCQQVFASRLLLSKHRDEDCTIVSEEPVLQPCTCFQDSGICDQHEANAW